MKNLIRKSLLIALLITATISTAKGNDPSIKVDVIKSKMVHLTMQGNLKALELLVKDKYGVVLHSELIQNGNLSRKFDLATLPVGDYSLEVESLTNIKTIPFAVSLNNVEFNKSEEELLYKPVIKLDETKVLISQLALNDENLEITVYNKYDELIYSEVLEAKDKTLKRKLDFVNVESGSYKLILKNGENTFYETIAI